MWWNGSSCNPANGGKSEGSMNNSWVFISAYRPCREKSENKIEKFFNKLNGCVGSFGKNESMVVIGN